MRGLADGPASHRSTRCGLKESVQNLGIKIDFAGPFDGAAELAHAHLRKEARIAKRLEDAFCFGEFSAQVDLFNRPVGEGDTDT